MTSANTGRLEAARFAVRSHQWAKGDAFDEDECAVIDLLTDLRHYCDARGFHFEDLDRVAAMHHDAETLAGGMKPARSI